VQSFVFRGPVVVHWISRNMKCSVCDGQSISEAVEYASFETHLRVKGGSGGWLKRDLTIKPEKARVCMECGHVMLFVAPSDLSRLNRSGD
jgi:hypothetical protein